MTIALPPQTLFHYHSGITARIMTKDKDPSQLATQQASANQVLIKPMEDYYQSTQHLRTWLEQGERETDQNDSKKPIRILQDLCHKPVLVTDELFSKEFDTLDIYRNYSTPLVDLETHLKERTLRKRLLETSPVVLIDPLVDNPKAFIPEKHGTYTEEQRKQQNQLMDEQDKQLKQWKTQHVSFPFLGVPPIPAVKVMGLRDLQAAITAEQLQAKEEATNATKSIKEETGSATKTSKTRSGAVYLPIEIAANNTLHPVALSDSDRKKLAAMMLPTEKNLQNPLGPMQFTHDYYQHTTLILTGEDAYKETVTTVNSPYFTPRVNPDPYGQDFLHLKSKEELLARSKVAIPLDVTPLLQKPLAFSDARLEWLTPKQEQLAKVLREEVLTQQESTLAPLKKAKQPIIEAINPSMTTADVVSLREAKQAINKELKALQPFQKLIAQLETEFWEPLSLYKPKAYQPIMVQPYLLSVKPEKKS